MFPPQLTESWSIAYIEILLILLIFAYGIPSLIFQISISEEERSIIQRYLKHTHRSIFIYAMGLTMLSILFLWLFHTCSLTPAPWKHWVSICILSITLISVFWIWWKKIKELYTEKLIHQLEKIVLKKYGKTGIVPESIIKDIIILAEKDSNVYERKIILASLEKIIKKIITSKRYSGSELEEILREIDTVLINGNILKNPFTIYLTFRIFKLVLEKHFMMTYIATSDELIAQNALGKIGVLAIKQEYDYIAQAILETFSNQSDYILQIGIYAIESKRYLVALAALNKLEYAYINENYIDERLNANLFGLMSFFWMHIELMRDRIYNFIISNKIKFKPTFKLCIDNAINFLIKTANFYTANNIINMKNDIIKLI